MTLRVAAAMPMTTVMMLARSQRLPPAPPSPLRFLPSPSLLVPLLRITVVIILRRLVKEVHINHVNHHRRRRHHRFCKNDTTNNQSQLQ